MSRGRLTEVGQGVLSVLGQVLVGQRSTLEGLVVALLAGGHVLLEGPPGTGKTLMVRALSRAVGGRFGRAQFTPDLLPSDVLGTYVLRGQGGSFELREGPVFTDLLLADEINRAPPRTQSALLEAMQERQVTLDGRHHPLSPGFFVVATQNPLEFEGTYPLPEAQLDRFLMKLQVAYPTQAEEVALLSRFRDASPPSEAVISPVADLADIVSLRGHLREVAATDALLAYVAEIVRRTRRVPGVAVGAGPRAAIALFEASRARAALSDRDFITPDDVKAMASPVLRHRLVLHLDAEAGGAEADGVIAQVLGEVEVPR